MVEMIFTFLDEQPIPVPPMGANAEPIQADNDKYFAVDEAAKKAKRPEDWMRQLWMATYGWLLAPDDAATVAEGIGGNNVAASAAGDPVLLNKLELVRQIDSPEIDRKEYAFVVQYCQARGLNLLTRQVKPIVRMENGRRRIEIITTVGAFRLIGQRNGCHGETCPEFAGKDGQWKELWTDAEHPFAARVGVKKPGATETTWAIAYWDAVVQYATDARGNVITNGKGEVLPSDFWIGCKGVHQLGKCAVAAAYRAACPDDLGQLYTFDEMMQMKNPRPQRPEFANVAPVDRDEGEDPQDVLVDDSTPTTERSFDRELIELNFNTPESRQTLIRQMSARFPGVRTANPPRFYALVLHTVRPNPQAYGAEENEVLAASSA